MGSHNKAATEVAAHEEKTTGVHGVGASAVCSKTEADGKITTHKGDPNAHHTPMAPGLTVALFQENVATGTIDTPAALNDNDTGTCAFADAVAEYGEVDFGKNVTIYQYRQFGKVTNNADGRWKIEYWDGSWHDWVMGIATRTTADWSAWAAGPVVVCSKIRLTCTTVDGGANKSEIMELEISWG